MVVRASMRRLITQSSFIRASMVVSSKARQQDKLHLLPPQHLARMASYRFLDIYQLASKAAIKKERARIADEMSRGYFADMAELKKHGGKIAIANKVIIPAMVAVKFPDLEVIDKDGMTAKLPCRQYENVNADQATVPKASLLCLSFRANSQAMINSWSSPFIEAFSKSENVHVCEVSFIDSWLLRRNPIKHLLLWYIRKSNRDESKNTLQKKTVYSFGDHYYFRKELKILNLLTGYIFLLDKFGRIRWQGFGMASEDELASLFSCTSVLLKEESGKKFLIVARLRNFLGLRCKNTYELLLKMRPTPYAFQKCKNTMNIQDVVPCQEQQIAKATKCEVHLEKESDKSSPQSLAAR